MTGPTFIISGIEPYDLAIEPDPIKLWFWGQVVELVVKAKDDELSRGLDRFGNPLVAITKRTRKYRKSAMGPADPDAPPLTPAHGLSRTRSLFTGLPRLEYAEFGWNYDEDTGASWGDILDYHAQGAGNLPVRDVLGLSPDSLGWVKREASKRWMDFRRARNAGLPPVLSTVAPPRIEPTGITDLRGFTFGIGGTREEVQRAIDAGLSTGFRQLHAGPPAGGRRPPPGPLRPGVTVPSPAPKPPPRHAVAKAATEPAPRVKLLGKPGEVRAELKELAPQVPVSQLSGLTGATRGAKVTGAPMSSGKVFVRAVAPEYEARVQIESAETLRVTGIDVPEASQRKGIGSGLIERIIGSAERAGFKEITMRASRTETDTGYAVWPRFGFDGPIPPQIAARLPAWLKGAKTIGDLFATPAGREWWRINGTTVELSLKLREKAQ